MSAETAVVACQANIGRAGKRRRIRIGAVLSVITVGLFGWLLAIKAPWEARLALFLPAAMTGVVLLQVTRNTCVRMAQLGVVENEDFSTTRVEQALAEASRRMAATIIRDGMLIGAFVAGLSALTVFVR